MSLRSTREELLSGMEQAEPVDVVIIGGGIHGASFARLSAHNGLRTVLIEKGDYGSGTSSRSSKMLHGGLRYLEMFDFLQVFEGIRARDALFRVAPHLATPSTFAIPIFSGETFFQEKLRAGLKLYDLFSLNWARRSRWITARTLEQQLGFSFSKTLRGAHTYIDGISDDVRVVLETIISAREAGAHCLNYVSWVGKEDASAGVSELSVRDEVTGKHFSIKTRAVVNCAGPWAIELAGSVTDRTSASVGYSQGVHLLFPHRWTGPSLFLPMEGRARYYFVWPHFSGTLVGTTERRVHTLEDDPQPVCSEIEELYERLERDLPGSGLERGAAHYAFAGVRTIVLRGASSDLSQASRRHRWLQEGNLFTLLGGKFTTAASTVLEGVRCLRRFLGVSGSVVTLRSALYPGARDLKLHGDLFRAQCSRIEVSEATGSQVLRRLGGRVSLLQEDTDDFTELLPGVLRGEVRIALEYDQARTLEDLLRRRLQVECLPDFELEEWRDAVRFQYASSTEEIESYRFRMEQLRSLL